MPFRGGDHKERSVFHYGNLTIQKFYAIINNMSKKIWIDPPAGWKYGFPKVYDQSVDGDCTAWMLKNGYPQREIDSCGNHFHVRMWAYDDENEKTEKTS